MTSAWQFAVAFLVGAWCGVGLMAVLAATGHDTAPYYSGDPDERYDEGFVADYTIGTDDAGHPVIYPVIDP
jgi:hypothetical protein